MVGGNKAAEAWKVEEIDYTSCSLKKMVSKKYQAIT